MCPETGLVKTRRSSSVRYGWACTHCSLWFLLLADRNGIHVAFGYCSPFTSRFGVLCIMKCCSAYRIAKNLFTLPHPSCQLEPLWALLNVFQPLSSTSHLCLLELFLVFMSFCVNFGDYGVWKSRDQLLPKYSNLSIWCHGQHHWDHIFLHPDVWYDRCLSSRPSSLWSYALHYCHMIDRLDNCTNDLGWAYTSRKTWIQELFGASVAKTQFNTLN